MTSKKITDDLDALLQVLPPKVSVSLVRVNSGDDLLEVILDLGRIPAARFTYGEVVLSNEDTSQTDIAHVCSRIGDFDADNRAGIERTLHRIAAIRNRQRQVVGLTCRIGRSVYGTTDIIQDLIESGKSLLFVGRPGVGKTTMLREAARILAEQKRTVIVDTSNEIGGDGDVPHPAVGKARRMQVPKPSLQHEVMIEAVENHNPEVIVIDEIGRELEALAARTIAERGVQLIGTAHGNTIENLLLNPTLADLLGGIESVTLSDEEARRRGTQKTILERRSPPTFDVLIEIQTRDILVVHQDVAEAVDSLLREQPYPVEIRTRDEKGGIKIEKILPKPSVRAGGRGMRRQASIPVGDNTVVRGDGGRAHSPYATKQPFLDAASPTADPPPVCIYPFGVARNRLSQAIKQLEVPVHLARDISEADLLVTLRTYYRKRQRTIMNAERSGKPIYVLRANTITQMQRFLSDLFNMSGDIESYADDEGSAIQEAHSAIDTVLSGERWVDLSPAAAHIRRLQHQLAKKANLVSHSYGKTPRRRVRISRD